MLEGQYSPIVQYQPSREFDYAVLNMLEAIEQNWDADYLLSPALRTPSTLLAYFSQWPLYTQFHANQIVHAGWFIPFMGAAVLDHWVHPDYRGTKHHAYFLFELIQGAFDFGAHAVIGWVQERATYEETCKFIRLHEKLGYEYSGLMKQCFEGQDCHVMVITQDGFNAATSRIKTKWLETRG